MLNDAVIRYLSLNDAKMRHLENRPLENVSYHISLLILNFFILNREILTKMIRDFLIPEEILFSQYLDFEIWDCAFFQPRPCLYWLYNFRWWIPSLALKERRWRGKTFSDVGHLLDLGVVEVVVAGLELIDVPLHFGDAEMSDLDVKTIDHCWSNQGTLTEGMQPVRSTSCTDHFKSATLCAKKLYSFF